MLDLRLAKSGDGISASQRNIIRRKLQEDFKSSNSVSSLSGLASGIDTHGTKLLAQGPFLPYRVYTVDSVLSSQNGAIVYDLDSVYLPNRTYSSDLSQYVLNGNDVTIISGPTRGWNSGGISEVFTGYEPVLCYVNGGTSYPPGTQVGPKYGGNYLFHERPGFTVLAPAASSGTPRLHWVIRNRGITRGYGKTYDLTYVYEQRGHPEYFYVNDLYFISGFALNNTDGASDEVIQVRNTFDYFIYEDLRVLFEWDATNEEFITINMECE